jgi:hypothetical protein
MNEQEPNRRIADTICEQFAWHGQSFREGDFVAILDGKVVAVRGNFDEAIAALRALEPNPQRGMVIEVARPTTDTIRLYSKSRR